MSEIQALFTVKPVRGTSRGKIKCIGHIKKTDKFNDEPLMCNEDVTKKQTNEEKYVYILREEVHARFFRPTISDRYLMSTKVLPVMYGIIGYKQKLTSGTLLMIIVEFKIEKDVKSEKELIGSELDGKYQIRIKKMTENQNDYIGTSAIELDNYLGDKNMIETIKKMMKTDEIDQLIDEMLEVRKKERIEKYGGVDDQLTTIPKTVYKFNDLVEQFKQQYDN